MKICVFFQLWQNKTFFTPLCQAVNRDPRAKIISFKYENSAFCDTFKDFHDFFNIYPTVSHRYQAFGALNTLVRI